jgi:hypothetical protein
MLLKSWTYSVVTAAVEEAKGPLFNHNVIQVVTIKKRRKRNNL